MSTYIDIDSQFRIRGTYPNPADFEVTASQVDTWFSSNRTTRPTAMNPASSPYEFSTVVYLDRIIVPYVTTPFDLSTEPRLYVDFHSKRYEDIRLINAIGGVHADAKFVCNFERYQEDSTNTRIWMQFKCDQHQVMRFRRKDPVMFRVTDRLGNVIPLDLVDDGPDPDPASQVMATFKITPYIIDGDYTNQLIQPITMNQT